MSTYFVPGTVLDAGETVQDKRPCFCSAVIGKKFDNCLPVERKDYRRMG